MDSATLSKAAGDVAVDSADPYVDVDQWVDIHDSNVAYDVKTIVPLSDGIKELLTVPEEANAGYMDEIKALTPEMEKRIPEIRERWLGHGLSTKPAEFQDAFAATKHAYTVAGMTPPTMIVTAASPQAGCRMAALVRRYGDLLETVRFGTPQEELDKFIAENPKVETPRLLRNPVEMPDILLELGWSMLSQMARQADDPVAARTRARYALAWLKQELDGEHKKDSHTLHGFVRDELSYVFWGQHESSWMAFYDFFLIYLACVQPLRGLLALAQSCGWCWFFDDIAVIADRPTSLHRDAELRLHCEFAPAIEYRDGFKIYAWHQIQVLERIIMQPETITADEILKETNAEIRRILMERVGWERFIKESGAERIQQDDAGRLYRIPLEGDEDLVVVRLVNSTAEPDGSYKEYFLRVNPDTKTAIEGVASSFGLSVEDYLVNVET